MEDFDATLDDRVSEAPISSVALPTAGRRELPAADKGDPYGCFTARCSIQGTRTGPLSGKRVGLKDNIALAGIPMTLGSPFMEGFVPDIDAPVVTRLLEAGAEIVGKLAMDAFSFAAQGFGTGQDDSGRCANPWAREHMSGGSSSGSAVAAASGVVDIALGGDQGGSIRVPAAWCGVVGLKPSYGLVPNAGVFGLDPSIDHVGPVARRVADVATALDCLVDTTGRRSMERRGPRSTGDRGAPSTDVRGLRVGVLAEGFGCSGSDSTVEATTRTAIDALSREGAEIVEVSIPEHQACGRLAPVIQFVGTAVMMSTYGSSAMDGMCDPSLVTTLAARRWERADLLPPRVKLSILLTAHLGSRAFTAYSKAQSLRHRYRAAYDRVLGTVDCLVMPTVPVTAPKFEPAADGDETLRRSLVRRDMQLATANTPQFNITGHPALSVPAGMVDGLPVGLMIVGRPFDDRLVLRVALAVEQLCDIWSYAPR